MLMLLMFVDIVDAVDILWYGRKVKGGEGGVWKPVI